MAQWLTMCMSLAEVLSLVKISAPIVTGIYFRQEISFFWNIKVSFEGLV